MKRSVGAYAARGALGLVGLGVGVAGVLALREATLSTHQHVPPGARHQRKPRGNLGFADCVSELVDQPDERGGVARPRRADRELAHSHSIVPGGLLV